MNVQRRVAEVLDGHFVDREKCACGGCSFDWESDDLLEWPKRWAAHVAEALVSELEIWLPPLFASAIHGYADSELMRMPGYGDDPTGQDALEQLNRDAADIALYSLTSIKWKPQSDD